MSGHKEVYNDIIYLIENNKIREANILFNQHIKRIHHMNDIVYLAFSKNKYDVGKQLIKFNFPIRNQGYEYFYSPFDLFCHVCKYNHVDLLFNIIEDSYFWTKDRVIFEPKYKQSPKQWLIATAGYILCNLNNVKSIKLLCEKYNITKFDADQSNFFEIASKNNFEELLNFLINRYGFVTYESNEICETSLYDLPIFDGMRKPTYDEINKLDLSVGNPMYLHNTISDDTYQQSNKNNIELKGIDNALYRAIKID